MEVRKLVGDALANALDDVARLRIEVFRAFPYLYDGDLAYERDYLRPYVESDSAIIVGAFDGDRLVGAATGTPLRDHADDFAAAFAETHISLNDVFYCAESVLLPEYRGMGLGHDFFDHREAHARSLGFSKAAFCAVLRENGHPLRPEGYVPLDGFWRKRGYAPLKGAVAGFEWKDIDKGAETEKALQFWIRDL
ncbi:GNAT family N-acetyltransferase [Shimia sp. W99]|uniref:Ribosomal protein S18 acetylase RimI n=1 Tax=Shimia aestuarii TaxID=254406 RepID=A0A1I4MR88_9RHOB|nr:GNAT family N-acetyltransferase [Shimia aestuarii]SFM05545.1 Ribosomal protein S18 acetylase RimI [Shimia aestuarii]